MKVSCLKNDFHVSIHSQFSSVAQSCPTLCNPMNRSKPGLPVHHQLPESAETHSQQATVESTVHRFITSAFKSYPQFSSVQSLSRVQLFATPWTAACQASLSITDSQSLLKLVSIESVMSSNHLILCRPLLLFSSVQFTRSVVSNSLQPHEPQQARPPHPSPTPGVHSNSPSIESVMPSSHLILCRPLFLLPPILPSIKVFPMSWLKYWSFSFSIIPSKEHPGLI